MQINGIDLDGLAHDATDLYIPPVVPDRVVHIDADFLAYQVSAEKADGSDQKSFEDMQHNAEVAVETIRSLAAAERVHLHLTPKGSNKGNRYNLAILKEYQATRKGKEKPRYLGIMRDWLATRFPATQHILCEADDGMSSAQYLAHAEGRGNLSIIASKDKDLRMVPGLHLDWDTGGITECDEFGMTELVETGKNATKKIKGHGQKLFWYQMLTGDSADNISGLPAVSGKVLNRVQPNKGTQGYFDILADPNESEHRKYLAQAALDSRKAKSCGPVLAYDLLKGLNTNRQCYEAVKALYRLYGEETGFVHWSTGEPVQWGRALVSEGQLLWMRKQPHNDNCVLDYWRSIH